mgnify:CR=1 FL=1
MEQRLIDANALHYRMGVNRDDKQIFYVTGEDIDRQPTIDPESLRPMAHWVHKQTKLPGGVLQVEECSLCECQMWRKTNFCPDCGARMKMED